MMFNRMKEKKYCNVSIPYEPVLKNISCIYVLRYISDSMC